MNVLILSCNTGGGHNAAARAAAEAFRAHGEEAAGLVISSLRERKSQGRSVTFMWRR